MSFGEVLYADELECAPTVASFYAIGGEVPPIDRKNLWRFSASAMTTGSPVSVYFPPPVKAVSIPKKSRGTHLLGVPTVADRVAQTVVKKVLEPLLEPVFDHSSFGYRSGRSALDAVALVRRRSWEYDWVVEFDGLALAP